MVGSWCGGKMCTGMPYARCHEWRGPNWGGHCKNYKVMGWKGAGKCPQGINCGMNNQFAHWSKFQPGTQCGGLSFGPSKDPFFNIVYEIKGYDKRDGQTRHRTACAGEKMTIGSCVAMTAMH